MFHNIIHDNIDKGLLKFLEGNKEDMGVDEDPFPSTMPVNMVEIKIEETSEKYMNNKEDKGKTKMSSSSKEVRSIVIGPTKDKKEKVDMETLCQSCKPIYKHD